MSTTITFSKPKTILNPASGYLDGYTHTLNPYSGCSFACSYCYVRQMPIALFHEGDWGNWVTVKEGAAEVLRKDLAKARRKGEVTIFMSSSTDPYQPAEYEQQVTRSLLEVMIESPPDFLFVQTRSPLVTRDIDLLQALGDRVRVSMTIETDREDVRQSFTPSAPPLAARFKALQQIVQANIPAQATIAPALPCTEHFAQKLSEIVDKVCLDDYFMGDGMKGKRTERIGVRAIYEQMGLDEWYNRDAYKKVLEQLQMYFTEDQIGISQDGFKPQ
ncbi:radical SAM protein [Paenibacillus sp. N1-5-1-14]|uniref:SPL family radical SAM protein n=1 Tax=Paenibacillus radicibacter TaxID=2972488 RepID=UPI0021592AFA|nr:radical SAM protein [Paenibacillus radicibacter]MCR8643232.1 radical SAM protein [Paenibacillus radicibacter]